MFFEMSLSCHQHPFFKFSHNIHEEVRQLPLTQKKWRITFGFIQHRKNEHQHHQRSGAVWD